jgi:hypothetical protein
LLRDRTVQDAHVVARAHNVNLNTIELASHRFAILALSRNQLLRVRTLASKLLDQIIAGLGRKVARQQEVAGLTTAHADHIADDADAVDVFNEQKGDVLRHDAVLQRFGSGCFAAEKGGRSRSFVELAAKHRNTR